MLQVSSVIHEAYISVSEEGSEAAAATEDEAEPKVDPFADTELDKQSGRRLRLIRYGSYAAAIIVLLVIGLFL